MSKTVLSSKFTEHKGLDRLSSAIHEMNCIFRELSKDDFGIDGEMELVLPKVSGKGYETTGGIIKVQLKSGDSYVVADSDSAFKTSVKKDDLLYWNGATFPVIFVVYHPKDDKLYWKEIKSYVKTTPNVLLPPYHVAFTKAEDEFSKDCFGRICQLAMVSPPRVNFDQKERLFSNLLLVKRLPKHIYYAPTDQIDTRQIKDELRAMKQQAAPFVINDGTLYTLADLRAPQSVLRPYCDAECAEETRPQSFAEGNPRDFVYLLNQLLGMHLRACGLWYSPEFRRNFSRNLSTARSVR